MSWLLMGNVPLVLYQVARYLEEIMQWVYFWCAFNLETTCLLTYLSTVNNHPIRATFLKYLTIPTYHLGILDFAKLSWQHFILTFKQFTHKPRNNLLKPCTTIAQLLLAHIMCLVLGMHLSI